MLATIGESLISRFEKPDGVMPVLPAGGKHGSDGVEGPT